ncbi:RIBONUCLEASE H1 [Ceraceosorus bombacis]|uniref:RIBONUCLEASE H1 n=1 Tax=Ceraceosorus bombacis TaxID=401625 RepID=A0A0P1B9S9_9BASI|nr:RIBONUCLEASE H1 [Ceraceosorus bombacis]
MAEGNREKERGQGGAATSTTGGALRGLARSLSLRPKKAASPQLLPNGSIATEAVTSGKGSLDTNTANAFTNNNSTIGPSSPSTSAGFAGLGFATLQSPTRKTSRSERRPAHQLFDDSISSSPGGRGPAVGHADGAVVEWGRPPAQTDTSLRDVQVVGLAMDNSKGASNSSSTPLRSVSSISSVGAGQRFGRNRDASGGTIGPSRGASSKFTTLRDAPLSSSDPALETGLHVQRGKGVDRANASAPAGLAPPNEGPGNSSSSSSGGSSLVKKLSLRRKPQPRPDPPLTSQADNEEKALPSITPSPYHLTAPFGRRSFDSLVSVTGTQAEMAPSYTQGTAEPMHQRGHARRKTATDRQALDPPSGAVAYSPSSSRGLISSTTRGRPAREGSAVPTSSAYPTGYWAPPPYAYATAQNGGEHGISLGDEMDAMLSSEARERREALRGHSPPFFAVRRGWRKGIYTEEDEASRQTQNFPGPIVKRFESADEAVAFVCAPTNPSKPSFTRKDSSDSILPRPVAAPALLATVRTSTLGRSRSLASSTTSGRSFGARRGAAMGYLDEPSRTSPSSTSGQSFSFENEATQAGGPDSSKMARSGSNRPASRKGAENAMPSVDEDGTDHNLSLGAPGVRTGSSMNHRPAPFDFSTTTSHSVVKDRASPSLAYFAMASSPLTANAAALGAEAFGRAASPGGLASESHAQAHISPLILPERPTTPAKLPRMANGGAVFVIEDVTNLERSLAFYSAVFGANLAQKHASALLLRVGSQEHAASPTTRILLRLRAQSPFEDRAEKHEHEASDSFASSGMECSVVHRPTAPRVALLIEFEAQSLREVHAGISDRLTNAKAKQGHWKRCAVTPMIDTVFGTREARLTGPDGETWILSSPIA